MKLLRRLSAATIAGVVAFSTILSISLPSVAYAVTQTCTWTGTAADNKFSTATNWSDCNSVAPQTGDTIKLPYISGSSLTLTNDLPAGVLLGGLTIDSEESGTLKFTNYTIDKLAFGDGAIINKVSRTGVSISDTVTAAGALTTNTMYPFYAVAKNVTLALTDLTLTSATPVCSGGSGGMPEFDFKINPTGQVNVGSGNWYGVVGTESAIIVASGSNVSVPKGTYAGNITFNGGGATQGYCDRGFSLTAFDGNTTLSGTITLAAGDVGYNIGYNKTLTITGTITGANAKLFGHTNSAGTFVNSAATNNSTTSGGSQTMPVKELAAITDNQPDAFLSVESNEIVSLDGVRRDANVAAKATLKGTGTIKNGLYVGEGATIAPGHSPGCLTSDTLNLSGTYQFELGGTDPCTGYDQLIVKNAASSTYGVILSNVGQESTSILSTTRYNDYTPKQGQVFIIINQEGDKPVMGTFKNLPEGATFEQNGVVFKISYVGGTGNDVTLTVQNAPAVPDTGLSFATSSPVIVLAAMTALSAGIVLTARRLSQVKTKR